MNQLKIIRSTKPTYWYADKVGQIFDIIGETEEYYEVYAAGEQGETRFVYKRDAELI